MPNRVLRDWTNSDKINSVSVHAERFFTRLIMQADDFGRFHASPRLLSSYLFPLKDDMRDADITRCLTECEAAGLIVVYEASGKKFVLKKFQQCNVSRKREPFFCFDEEALGKESRCYVECEICKNKGDQKK